MIWLIPLVVIVFCVQCVFSDREGVATAGFIVGVMATLLLLFGAGGAGCAHATFGNELARIAELRRIAASVDLRASEDIAGKVADTNIEIRTTQWQNRQWWGDPFVPDGWDTVTVITTPAN